MYVAITSVDPLRAYIYDSAIEWRFAPKKYVRQLDERNMQTYVTEVGANEIEGLKPLFHRLYGKEHTQKIKKPMYLNALLAQLAEDGDACHPPLGFMGRVQA